MHCMTVPALQKFGKLSTCMLSKKDGGGLAHHCNALFREMANCRLKKIEAGLQMRRQSLSIQFGLSSNSS